MEAFEASTGVLAGEAPRVSFSLHSINSEWCQRDRQEAAGSYRPVLAGDLASEGFQGQFSGLEVASFSRSPRRVRTENGKVLSFGSFAVPQRESSQVAADAAAWEWMERGSGLSTVRFSLWHPTEARRVLLSSREHHCAPIDFNSENCPLAPDMLVAAAFMSHSERPFFHQDSLGDRYD